MNKQNYILEVLAEECAEIQHIMSKIIRFGIHSYHPDTKVTNGAQLFLEVADMMATVDMLREENPAFNAMFVELDNHKEAKIKKVEYFMQLSRDIGTLDNT